MTSLAALLQQADPAEPTSVDAPVTAKVPLADDNPLATHELALSLRLAPAGNFNDRAVSGTIGIKGQMPCFLGGTVTLSNLLVTLQTLYPTLTPPAAPAPAKAASTTTTSAAVIATAEPEPAAASQLDIF